MSNPAPELKIEESPDVAETGSDGTRRSKLFDFLALSSVALLFLLGLVVFQRYDLAERVTTLEGLLTAAEAQNDDMALEVARSSARVGDLRANMSEINTLSTELIGRLSALRDLSAESLAELDAMNPTDPETVVSIDLEVTPTELDAVADVSSAPPTDAATAETDVLSLSEIEVEAFVPEMILAPADLGSDLNIELQTQGVE